MLKNAYFLEKDVKNRLSVGGPAPEPPLADPHVVTPAYYYNFVKFIFSTKCGLLPSKKEQILLFQIFAAIFHFKLCSFC